MNNFWENYKKNLQLLATFAKKYWKVLLVISFAVNFIVIGVNTILSLYVINPKYFLGEEYFLSEIIESLVAVSLMIWTFLKYIQYKQKDASSKDSSSN